ncbi:outer membrane protein assembly factor BamB family protein [Rhodopirellula halodulae]|uniref:outer membrane protein assembly factor BamB family protein n=1 Tax=Rhodopirellula halodulae TaxID=2894198 RepID=UPI001E637E7D|nr:PQQ-binding-like beta-propeller repeat protein [Rhodopirellula sp. JC737]MCC9656232.1 PQQ-like beta-propeller repeat protein [Rhodopirellula sp. JC737]
MMAGGSTSLVPTAPAADINRDWPQWRGPDGSGVAEDSNPPITWSESENIRWKIDVPGVGSSTPIVLGDRVYVSTAVKTDRVAEKPAGEESAAEETPQPEAPPRRSAEPGSDDDRRGPGRGGRGRGRGRGRGGFGGGAQPTNYYDFMVIAYNRSNGEEVWRTSVTQQVPHEAGHNTNNFASSSPVTDGKRLYMSFGSRGVFCLDLEGKQLWDVNLGQMQTRAQFGEGSSPSIHNDVLVVPWDHEGESFIVALDAQTGEEKWRQSRDEQTTWSTPLITEYDGRTQVITNGSKRVRSYDLMTGELIWECGGQAGNPIPSPVRFEDNVIVMTGFRGYAIYSIPLNSKGDITDSDQITWYEEDAAPYVPSPVLYKGQLYFVKSNNGVLVSRSAKTGELLIDQTRLPDISSVYASPVAAADHIYFTGRDGTTLVLKHGNEFQTVATNELEEEIDASPAIVGDEIFLRGKSHLYCIAK